MSVVRRLAAAAAGTLVSALVIASASAMESTIVPGRGIGKVRVGMTRAQVEAVLGKDAIVNVRTTVAKTTYLELGWNFSTFSVGFLQQGRTYRVAQVETTLRGERTAKRIGVGSSFTTVAHAYPEAICGSYFTSMGSSPYAGVGPGGRHAAAALVVAKERKHLAFLLQPATPHQYFGRWVVYGVIVRASIPGAVDFPPRSRCRPGWQERGTPYAP